MWGVNSAHYLTHSVGQECDWLERLALTTLIIYGINEEIFISYVLVSEDLMLCTV